MLFPATHWNHAYQGHCICHGAEPILHPHLAFSGALDVVHHSLFETLPSFNPWNTALRVSFLFHWLLLLGFLDWNLLPLKTSKYWNIPGLSTQTSSFPAMLIQFHGLTYFWKACRLDLPPKLPTWVSIWRSKGHCKLSKRTLGSIAPSTNNMTTPPNSETKTFGP